MWAESRLVHVRLEMRSLGMSRAVHTPSTLGKHCHQKPSPVLTCQSGEDDLLRGRTGIRETITFPEASECELLPEETGFCSAWVQSALWRNSKAEETPSPASGWVHRAGLRALPDSRREGSWPPSPQGHPRGRHTSPLAPAGCRGLGPGHISSSITIGKSWASPPSPAASPLLVLAFLKALRG